METLDSNMILINKFTEPLELSHSNTPAWLYPTRRDAAARFTDSGLPTRRHEDWRFTNIQPIANTDFSPASSDCTANASHMLYNELEGTRLVFVNGNFSASQSRLEDTDGVFAVPLSRAFAEHGQLVEKHIAQYADVDANPFAALNTAAIKDGAFIAVKDNTVCKNPIHVIYLSDAPDGPTVSHPRSLLVLGANSQVTVIESFGGKNGQVYLANAVTEVVLGENAYVDHYKIQMESTSAFHVATMQVLLNRGSNFSSHVVNHGGKIVRNDANATMGGEGAECTLNGISLGHDEQLIDNHTSIDHAEPHCDSHELYKNIFDGNSRGVFNGKIFVRQDAQKTDAKQTNQTLLLSPNAQINTKPQLEIYADDVKCTHGATIGQLSAEQMFYLRSRGINKAQAQSLLTYAFASDVVSRIKVEPVRQALDAVLLSEQGLPGNFE